MDDVPLSNPAERTYESTERTSDPVKVQDSPRTREGGGLMTRSNISVIMSTVSHIIVCAITIYIVNLSFQNYSLFSWHPTLMTIGTLLLMAEAVMAMSEDNLLSSKLGRQARVRAHWLLQALAASFIFIGFLIIVVNKNINNKHHFHTWHSIFGLITVILVGMTSSGGVTALYSVKVKNIIRPALIKLMHNIVGIVTFMCGVLCIVLAFYSSWFQTNTSYSAQVCCILFVILSAAFTLESAFRSAYCRILYMTRGN